MNTGSHHTQASERKVQQQDAQHEGKMKSMQAHAAALEREMLELREASKNQVLCPHAAPVLCL